MFKFVASYSSYLKYFNLPFKCSELPSIPFPVSIFEVTLRPYNHFNVNPSHHTFLKHHLHNKSKYMARLDTYLISLAFCQIKCSACLESQELFSAFPRIHLLVCGFFAFYGFMAVTVSQRQQPIHKRWKHPDGWTLTTIYLHAPIVHSSNDAVQHRLTHLIDY